jgi:UDP-N-acetylglucosamine 2-epimerase (non-hydrolysing)
MKIISIVGARPQFIKEYVVAKAIRNFFDYVLVHTGQHYDFEMSQIFFDQLGISEPDYNLGLGSASQGEQTGKMLINIEIVLKKEKPDLVLVYGDTNSTLAGALSSAKLLIPVGHIEAGLRSYDRTMPEEINRILTDHASQLLFVPTKTAKNILKQEGITKGVHLTGDVMYDALLFNLKIAEKSTILQQLDVKPKEYFLTTIHRPSNTNTVKNLSSILAALSAIDEKVIFPLHPRTARCIDAYGLKKKIGKNIIMIKPVGYFDFIWLEKNAKKILTDSGGIQKEAYLLKVPCITLRENTEWVETIEDHWNILTGADRKKILDAIKNFEPKQKQRNLFGDGHASEKIALIVKKYLSK